MPIIGKAKHEQIFVIKSMAIGHVFIISFGKY